jgi:regulator of ribonuclease activity A
MTVPFTTSDIFDSHPTEVEVCDAQFRGFGRIRAFSGPCATVKTFEDPNPIRAAFEEPGEGRILVIDGGGSLRYAVIGDRMAALALRSGWAGVILYGAIRDSEALDTLDFGIKALGTIARRPAAAVGGLRDVAVTLAGATFHPGSWVYADTDAVLVARGSHKLQMSDA